MSAKRARPQAEPEDDAGTKRNQLENDFAELNKELDGYREKCGQLLSLAEQHSERVRAMEERLKAEASRQVAAVTESERRLEQLRAQIASCREGPPLRLNVGGARFEVARATAKRFPLSYFGQLLLEPEGEEHFVERSPHSFDLVLDFVRGTDLTNRLLASDRVMLERLLGEAEFYGLAELAAQVRQDLHERWVVSPTVNGTLLDGGLTLVKTADTGEKACISIGSVGWVAGVHEFSIVYEGDGCHVGVGVTRGGVHPTDLLRNLQLFYALDCGNGRAIGVGGVAKQVVEGVPATGFAPFNRVNVRLDLDKGTVCFGLNGVYFEPTFTNITPAVYYPYFFLGAMEKRLTVVR